MRVHRIALRNYRGVADCEVSFVEDGVTVVEGDNEIGKTSLTEALDLALTELDSSAKGRVKATQPIGRDVGPEVEIEISTGGYRLKLRKRWRRRAETVLEVTEPRHEHLTGREAHQRLRSILDETLDWGLWEALQVTQGAELRLPALGVASLGTALDTAAGGDDHPTSQDALWEWICAERSRYWTATGKVVKERQDSEAEVNEARDRLATLESSLREVDADVDEHARLARDHAQLNRDLSAAREHESEMSERWQLIAQLRIEAGERTAEHSAAVSERDQRSADVERRAELTAEFRRQDSALAELRDKREATAPALDAAVERVEDATAARDEASEALAAADDASKLADGDRDHHRQMIEVAQFRERLERIEQSQAKLAEAGTILDDIRVDDVLVEQIDKARIAVVRAEATAEGGSAHVTATALRAVTVAVDGIAHDLQADQQHDFAVSNAAVLEVGDSATVLVRAGKDSAEAARQLAEARFELQRLCDEGGVADLASAQAANRRRELAQRDRDGARDVIKENLRDLTLEELARMADRHDRRIADYTANRVAAPPLPTDLREATALAARCESLLEDRRATAKTSQEAAASAEAALTEVRLGAAELDGELQSAQSARDEALASLTEAQRQVSDDDLADALARSEDAMSAARDAAEAVRNKLLQEDADSVGDQLANARDTKQRLADEIVQNEGRQRELRGRLEARGQLGLSTQRDDAESALRIAERDHDGAERRALAVECLHRAFDARRSEARQQYLAPFREGIERLGRIVFGTTFKVELDEDLGIARRTLDGVTLDVNQLSTGAREQLGIIARLACASIVTRSGGGAPVVLDDALGWSDPSRLQRMGAAIAAAGKECQVIILTCTPGRYAHVGNATVVKLLG